MNKLDLSKYDPRWIKAAELLANKDTNGYTVAKIAEEVGISERQLYRWQTDPEFIELLDEFAERSMAAFTPELYAQLRKAVRSGSTRALELALKNRGKLIDRKEIAGSVDMNVKQSLTEQELLAEIEELRKRVDGATNITPALVGDVTNNEE